MKSIKRIFGPVKKVFKKNKRNKTSAKDEKNKEEIDNSNDLNSQNIAINKPPEEKHDTSESSKSKSSEVHGVKDDENLESLEIQHKENHGENINNLEQETQHKENYEDEGSKVKRKVNYEENINNLEQETQHKENYEDEGSKIKRKVNYEENINNLEQETQHKENYEDEDLKINYEEYINNLEQETQHKENYGDEDLKINYEENINNLEQETQHKENYEDEGSKIKRKVNYEENINNLEQETQHKENYEDEGSKIKHKVNYEENINNLEQETQHKENYEDEGSKIKRKVNYEENINNLDKENHEDEINNDTLQDYIRKIRELEEKNEELKKEASKYQSKLGNATNVRLGDEDSVKFRQDIVDLQRTLESYVTNLKPKMDINVENVQTLAQKYGCSNKITAENQNKPFIKVLLQRRVLDYILFELPREFECKGEELDIELKAQELLNLIEKFSTSRGGTDEIANVAAIKVRQQVYGVLGNRGFSDVVGPDEDHMHDFIAFVSAELNDMMNQYRKINDTTKKKEVELMTPKLIQDICRLFFYRLNVHEPKIQFKFCEKNLKIDQAVMKGRWDDDEVDQLCVDICYFPMIGLDLESSDRKIYTHAKIFPIKVSVL